MNRLIFAAALVVAVFLFAGCKSGVYNFVPSTEATYAPYPVDHPVDFFPDRSEPTREYIVIGMGDVIQTSWAKALEVLKPMAREHGADAILAGAVTGGDSLAETYRGTFIRYK